ncbi:MAG TPA: hypothetical protein VGX23_13340 [Actinocrinis sp.]|nr:hypothetical protein [Actinocrinis sp.]
MGRRAGRALAAAAVAGAALATPGPAQAHALPQSGAVPAAQTFTSAMYASAQGLPAALAVGGTIDLTVDMHWESLFPVDITGLAISMSNPDAGTAPTKGISVLWQDPRTGAWRASDQIDAADGTWTLTEPKRTVFIRAGGTLAVHLRITMSAKAAAGTEHVDAGQFSYLKESEGAVLRGTVTEDDYQGSFTFGAAGGSGGKTASPTPAPPAQLASTPTPVTAATPTVTATPAPTGTPSSSPAAISALPVGNAGAAAPKPAAPAPSPSLPGGTAAPQTITEANIVLRGANTVSSLGAVVVLLGFLAGSVLVILRSRRDERTAVAGPDTPDAED